MMWSYISLPISLKQKALHKLLFLLTFLLWIPNTQAEECWLYPPAGYTGIGGASELGPYSDYYDALRINNEFFDGWGSIKCSDTENDGNGNEEFHYGAVKFHNNTNNTLRFSVRSSPNGNWKTVDVKPGFWHWWWQECPCRFHVNWSSRGGGSDMDRYQEVSWYGFDYQPHDSEAYNWQFIDSGGEIILIEGSTAPSDKISQPVTVSLVGRGEGVTDGSDFGLARSAWGHFQVDFMPRVDGIIPSINGYWRMQWQRTLSSPDALVHEELWKLTITPIKGTKKQPQDIDVVIYGGAGTGEFLRTSVPYHPQVGVVDMRVHIQFNGSNVRLNFTKAF